MRIRELAELTGNTPETIRYYEKQGLLPEPRRESNNYRQYGQIHVNRLDFIRHCRNLDIGLSEIRELLGALDEGSREGAELAHKLIHQHMDAVDRRSIWRRTVRVNTVMHALAESLLNSSSPSRTVPDMQRHCPADETVTRANRFADQTVFRFSAFFPRLI